MTEYAEHEREMRGGHQISNDTPAHLISNTVRAARWSAGTRALFSGLCSLWLGQRGPPQAHDESTVMESASALDALLRLGVGDLHLRAALHVMDHITVDQMGVQTLHCT